MAKLLKLSLVSVLTLSVTACAAVVDRRGFLPETEDQLTITPGEDTKASVLARLGNPSQQGVFDTQVWYYIAAVEERQAFYLPRTVSRQITAVHFDELDNVEDVRLYGLEDGRVIAYDDRRTPTRGREVTFLEQLFGSVGRAPVALPGQDPNLPTGTGGPRRQ